MTVRVKQKPQHHWSPTTSHPPPLHPLLWPPAPPLLLPFAFWHRCFWKFSKNWKEEGDNMYHKHVALRFEMQITCPHRGQQRLCTWQWTKIKIQWQLIWPKSCFKIIAKWYNMQNTYESDLLESALKPFSKVTILESEKSKKLAFRTTCKHFSCLSK